MPFYLYTIRPVRAGFHLSPTDAESETVSLHFQYLKSLQASGQLFLAGRRDDASLGIALLSAGDDAEAQALFDADPAVQSGVFEGEIRLFRLAISSPLPQQ